MAVGDHPAVKVHTQSPVGLVRGGNVPDIPVEDIPLRVIADLHDPVTNPKGQLAPLERIARRIEQRLHLDVDVHRPEGVQVHRRENLHIVARIKPELSRNPLSHQLTEHLENSIRIFCIDIEKVGICRAQFKRLAAVDVVRVPDNVAALILPEDALQSATGNAPGGNQIA